MEIVEQKFLKATFGTWSMGLEDAEARMINKTQVSDSTKREYYCMWTLKTFFSDGLNIDSNY